MDIVTNRSEVIEEILTKIKQTDGTASIVPGTPLYDLMVYHFADIITDERELVNIATNIARVSPMFGDDGKLLEEYADKAEDLTDRFFLTRPESNTIYDTLYLKFSAQTGVNVLAGSYVYYGNTKLNIVPTFITYDSEFWRTKVEDGKYVYLHPVSLDLTSDTEQYIPASDQWITGAVKLSSGTRCFVLGAETKKAINTYVEPEVTLDYLRNSISNRSLSNARSILYNLRNNTGFSPDKLKKAKVMHTMDGAFIERRKILFNDTYLNPEVQGDVSNGHLAGELSTLAAIVSGDGKVLLDYGVGLHTAPVTAKQMDRSDPMYSEINPFIPVDNPNDIVYEINVNNVRNLRGKITIRTQSDESNPDVSYYVVKAEVIDTDKELPDAAISSYTYIGESDPIPGTPRFERIWLRPFYQEGEAISAVGMRPSGWVSVECDLDRFRSTANGFESDEFVFRRDRFLLYRIDTTGLGLLSPVSMGSESDMIYLQGVLQSVDVNDLILDKTKASVSVPGSTLAVHSTSGESCPIRTADFIIRRSADEDLANNVLRIGSDRIYWRVHKFISGGVTKTYIMLSTDVTFKDKGFGAFLIPNDTVAVDNMFRLNCKVSSYATIRLVIDLTLLEAFDADQILTDQYFTMPAAFVRNSNRYLVLAVNPSSTVFDDDVTATLLYYGTDPDLMDQSQELYWNQRMAEVGNRIVVKPFRPVVFTAYWGPEYVTQYIPDNDPSLTSGKPEDIAAAVERYDTVRSQFIELQAFIEEYMSNFTGYVDELDFAEMVKQGQAETGLIMKRLDYTVFTQRGYAVRGVLDINLDKTCKFDWQENVLDVLEKTVNQSNVYISDECEYKITDVTMYRPLFSRVGV